MRKKLLLTLLFFSFCWSAQAAAPCYKAEELQAEQLLRLHSELLVVALTCRQSSLGRDLIKAYTRFTKANITTLHGAEAVLMNYYEKGHKGQGVSRLDTLRTRLANEYGQSVANETPAGFCEMRRDKALALYDSPQGGLSDTASRLYAGANPHAPVCKPLKTVLK